MNWQVYGTSNIQKIPKGRLLITLMHKANEQHVVNEHIKTIVRPKYVLNCYNPHYFMYRQGRYTVNSDFKEVVGPFTYVKTQEIRINHYRHRDLDFFYRIKLKRCWVASKKQLLIELDKDYSLIYDDSILKVLPNENI